MFTACPTTDKDYTCTPGHMREVRYVRFLDTRAPLGYEVGHSFGRAIRNSIIGFCVVFGSEMPQYLLAPLGEIHVVLGYRGAASFQALKAKTSFAKLELSGSFKQNEGGSCRQPLSFTCLFGTGLLSSLA